jgi:AraC family transcriptional regulator of adaptative response / DNA-3-methyladenine glycosylase II
MHLNRQSCTRAVETRDARFDGVFFVGISSTGIYCRPICPARATRRQNRRFFSNAAAAERAGFRPCLRCRPELAPGRARVDAVPRLAQSAALRIAAGALNGSDVERLASEFGVTGRQLRRALRQELGVSPIELAQTHRLLLAKQLLTDTRLPVSQIAYSSGFQSVRRFNALFRARYRLNPEALRRNRTQSRRAGTPHSEESGDRVRLTLVYRAPLAWNALLGFLGRRAAPAAECIDAAGYARTASLDGHHGVIRVTRADSARERPATVPTVQLEIDAALMPALMEIRGRVRRLFDLDAEPCSIEAQLSTAGLGPIAMAERGLRVPGAFDTFELAVRAILGQQVTVKGATTLMARLTTAFGIPIRTNHAMLTHLAATPERLADARLSAIRAIGLPLARASTIHLLAKGVAAGTLRIEPDADVPALMRQLMQLPGIGPWTAEYIVMRAVHWPDAFPAADLVLRRAAGNLTPPRMIRIAERWRPWRAYAAMHLWARAGQHAPAPR